MYNGPAAIVLTVEEAEHIYMVLENVYPRAENAAVRQRLRAYILDQRENERQ